MLVSFHSRAATTDERRATVPLQNPASRRYFERRSGRKNQFLTESVPFFACNLYLKCRHAKGWHV